MYADVCREDRSLNFGYIHTHRIAWAWCDHWYDKYQNLVLWLTCNGRDESNENKLCTNRKYKTTLSTEFYVKLNIRRDQWRILGRIKSRSLPLAIHLKQKHF